MSGQPNADRATEEERRRGLRLRILPLRKSDAFYWPETPGAIGEMNGVLQLPPTKNSDWF
jgi:hypothetical protein